MTESSDDVPSLRDLDRPTAIAVAHEVGASAARSGSPLHEVIDLVERGHDGRPEHHTVKAACLAWAEGMLDVLHGDTCQDALTTTVTAGHLASRVGDLLREAVATGLDQAPGVLVVLELGGTTGNALERSLHALEIAEVLRTVFPGEESIARLSPVRFGVLTRRERADETALALIRLLVARREAGRVNPRLWVEELPPTGDDVPGWMAALAR